MGSSPICLVHAFDSGNAADYTISESFTHQDFMVPAREVFFRCRFDNEGTPQQAAFKSWFNFCIVSASESPIAEQLLTFRWTNPPPTKKLLVHGYRPVFRFLDVQHKSLVLGILDAQNAGRADYITFLPTHRDAPYKPIESRCSTTPNPPSMNNDSCPQSLVFSIRIPKGTHIVQVSHSYPYPLNEIYARLRSLGKQWHVEETTLRGSAHLYKVAKTKEHTDRPIIYVSARCHPGETPGSYILEGLLDSLGLLLDRFQFWIVPAINSEGVKIGNYRADEQGYNLNRCYNKMEYPDLITTDILDLVSRPVCNSGYLPDIYDPLKQAMAPILSTKYFEHLSTFSGSSDPDEYGSREDGKEAGQSSIAPDFPLAKLRQKRKKGSARRPSIALAASDVEETMDTDSEAESLATPHSYSSSSSGSSSTFLSDRATAFEVSFSDGKKSVRRIRRSGEQQGRCVNPAMGLKGTARGPKSVSSDQSDKEALPLQTRQKSISAKVAIPLSSRSFSQDCRVPPRASASKAAGGKLSAGGSTASLISRPLGSRSQDLPKAGAGADNPYPAYQLTVDSKPLSYSTVPQIVFCLDIHAHASIPDCFLFGNSVFENGLPGISKDKLFLGQLRNMLFVSYMSALDPVFNVTKCDFKPDSMVKVDRAGNTFEHTMRVGLYAETGLPTVYCFESHYYRRTRDYSRKNLTSQDFLTMGNNLARALHEYYEFAPDKAMTYIKRLETNIHLGYSAQKLLAELRQATNGEHLTMLYKAIYDQLDYQLNGTLRRSRKSTTT